jgi:hypothetical protein
MVYLQRARALQFLGEQRVNIAFSVAGANDPADVNLLLTTRG